MTFYRVRLWSERKGAVSAFVWYKSRAEAEACAKHWMGGDYKASIGQFDVPTDEAGLLDFLNRHAGNP